MRKLIIFTDDEIEDLYCDKEVNYIDSNGQRITYMSETRYKKFIYEEWLKDE